MTGNFVYEIFLENSNLNGCLFLSHGYAMICLPMFLRVNSQVSYAIDKWCYNVYLYKSFKFPFISLDKFLVRELLGCPILHILRFLVQHWQVVFKKALVIYNRVLLGSSALNIMFYICFNLVIQKYINISEIFFYF